MRWDAEEKTGHEMLRTIMTKAWWSDYSWTISAGWISMYNVMTTTDCHLNMPSFVLDIKMQFVVPSTMHRSQLFTRRLLAILKPFNQILDDWYRCMTWYDMTWVAQHSPQQLKSHAWMLYYHGWVLLLFNDWMHSHRCRWKGGAAAEVLWAWGEGCCLLRRSSYE